MHIINLNPESKWINVPHRCSGNTFLSRSEDSGGTVLSSNHSGGILQRHMWWHDAALQVMNLCNFVKCRNAGLSGTGISVPQSGTGMLRYRTGLRSWRPDTDADAQLCRYRPSTSPMYNHNTVWVGARQKDCFHSGGKVGKQCWKSVMICSQYKIITYHNGQCSGSVKFW